MNERAKLLADRSDLPAYVTQRGKLLWIDSGRYDFCSIKGHLILVDQNGKFYGYAPSKKVKKLIYEEEE